MGNVNRALHQAAQVHGAENGFGLREVGAYFQKAFGEVGLFGKQFVLNIIYGEAVFRVNRSHAAEPRQNVHCLYKGVVIGHPALLRVSHKHLVGADPFLKTIGNLIGLFQSLKETAVEGEIDVVLSGGIDQYSA